MVHIFLPIRVLRGPNPRNKYVLRLCSIMVFGKLSVKKTSSSAALFECPYIHHEPPMSMFSADQVSRYWANKPYELLNRVHPSDRCGEMMNRCNA